MNTLPTVLENIIYDYKKAFELVEHKQKFKDSLLRIQNIQYVYDDERNETRIYNENVRISYSYVRDYDYYARGSEGMMVNRTTYDLEYDEEKEKMTEIFKENMVVYCNDYTF